MTVLCSSGKAQERTGLFVANPAVCAIGKMNMVGRTFREARVLGYYGSGAKAPSDDQTLQRQIAQIQGRLDAASARMAEFGDLHFRFEELADTQRSNRDRIDEIAALVHQLNDLRAAKVEQAALIEALFDQNRRLTARIIALEGATAQSAPDAPPPSQNDQSFAPDNQSDPVPAGASDWSELLLLTERSAGLEATAVIRNIRHELHALGLA
jgi:hypothetical protein